MHLDDGFSQSWQIRVENGRLLSDHERDQSTPSGHQHKLFKCSKETRETHRIVAPQ